MTTAQEIFDASFNESRTPRSHAYKAGCLAKLQQLIDRTQMPECPFTPPSSQFDAWFAGVDEARTLASRHRAEQRYPGENIGACVLSNHADQRNPS